jgi:hypothetical protein
VYGYTREVIEKNYAVFSRNLKNVKHILHSSLSFDFSTLGGRFDLIFVDGDHSYEAVRSDSKNVFGLLRNDSSIIVWHDYGLTLEHVNWEVLAGILDGLPRQEIHNLYHVSNTLCAIYIKGDFDVRNTSFPETPNKSFLTQISACRF